MIVLGGILGGIFTATEAAAIAVIYSLVLSVFVYREVKIKELPQVLLESGITTSVVMLLIATSMAMSWALAYENIPQDISAFLLGLTDNKILILLIINVILLCVGTFMGHDSGDPDFYSDFSSCGDEFGNESHSFWDCDDHEPMYRLMYSSRRNVSLLRMWDCQYHYDESNSLPDSIFYRTYCGAFDYNIYSPNFSMGP